VLTKSIKSIMEEEESVVCTICLEDIPENNSHSLDGCDHKFHASCIINWMQRGHLSCPSCRQDLLRADPEDGLSPMTLRERAKYLRSTVARRTSAPLELKRLVEKIRKAEEKEREVGREYNEFRRTHSETMKRLGCLRTQKYNARRRAYNLKRLLGMFTAPGIELPPIFVRPDRRYYD
jgi:hypothetical protein